MVDSYLGCKPLDMSKFLNDFKRMPWPLRVLTLLSLVSVIFVALTIVPGGAVVGQRRVGLKDWWINGSGPIFAFAISLFFCAGIWLLKSRSIGRLAYISSFAGLYVAAYLIEQINGMFYTRTEYFYDFLFAALQVLVLGAYLFLSRRVKAFLAT